MNIKETSIKLAVQEIKEIAMKSKTFDEFIQIMSIPENKNKYQKIFRKGELSRITQILAAGSNLI